MQSTDEAQCDFELEWIGGVLLARCKGLFTPAEARRLLSVLRSQLESRSAVKILVDLRKAAFLLGMEEIEQLAECSAKSAPVMAPIGYLADSMHWDVLFHYSVRMAAIGRTRYAFSDERQARAWAALPEPLLRPLRLFVPVWADD